MVSHIRIVYTINPLILHIHPLTILKGINIFYYIHRRDNNR